MKTLQIALLALILVQWSGPTSEVAGQETVDRIRKYRDEHAVGTIQLLNEFMQLPNVSADREGIRTNATFLLKQFALRDCQMQLLEIPGANPVVYGHRFVEGAQRTILIYAHFDGQPVNPARWTTTKPFEPKLFSHSVLEGGKPIPWPQPGDAIDPEWRIYGRSASDDKAPFAALLTALDALKSIGENPTSNIKFFFDGEEEIGSPNMQRVLSQHSDKFDDVDLWIFCDGPLHQSRQPTLYYGVRGVTGMELTVYGANRNLHSGHYGNWAPNPAMMLAQLLASMKDSDGNVLVPGFYDDLVPLSDAEQRAMQSVPPIDDFVKRELGLVETENQNQAYIERMQLPSLNVRGLESASVGATGRNIVPKEATASIDIRLVKGNHPGNMLKLVEDHIRQQGYYIIKTDPSAEMRLQHAKLAKVQRRTTGYPAARTRMDHAELGPLVRQLTSFIGDKELLQIPSLGGSLPLYFISEGLKQPLVILPLANHDNNQHAPDENLRLGNLMYGIEAIAAVLTMPPR